MSDSTYINFARLLGLVEGVYAEALVGTGINVLEAHILKILHADGAMRAGELARRTGRAATSFTPILDQLTNKFLIERATDPGGDRRAVAICLTKHGSSVAMDCIKRLDAADLQSRAMLNDPLRPAKIIMDDYVIDRTIGAAKAKTPRQASKAAPPAQLPFTRPHSGD